MVVFSAVVILLVVAALLFLLPPLIRGRSGTLSIARNDVNILLFKDQLKELETDLNNGIITQDQFQQAHADLERSLLQDVTGETDQQSESQSNIGKVSAVFISILIPVVAVGIYSQLGSGKQGFDPSSASPEMSTKGHQGTLEEQVRKLQDHLQANPDDIQGWVMLALSYYYLKQYQAASDAFARTVSMTGEQDANLLSDYADALAMSSGRSMAGKPYDLVKKALSIDSNNQKALWLAASATLESKEYETSLGYWQKLRSQFPDGSENYVMMTRNIAEVKQLMGKPIDAELAIVQKAQAQQDTASASQQGSAGAGNGKITGTVVLDGKFKDKASPSDTLFVYARATNGPRMPLAIIKTTVSDLPLNFTLDDSMAMNPQMKLSNFQDVIISARISKSGNAMPQNGDLIGSTNVVKVGTEGVLIKINGDMSSSTPTASSGAAPNNGQAAAPATGNAKLTGVVSLDAKLKDKVSSGDTLFVFARAANGPRMPLAIIRTTAADLPLKFTLDDSMAMNPQMSLSRFKNVVVSARISKSGNAMPNSGDLTGSSKVVPVGTDGLNITIDGVTP